MPTPAKRLHFLCLGILGLPIIIFILLTEYVPNPLLRKPLDYSKIQNLGGLRIEQPVEVAPNRWFLPLRFDVSGRRSITTESQDLDSAIGIREVVCWESRGEIHLRVYSSLISWGAAFREAYGVFLDGEFRGEVPVKYVGPHSEEFIGMAQFEDGTYAPLGLRD